jgi:hypothetical protein
MSDSLAEDVYRDRNLLACALANLRGPPMGGWTPADDPDDDDADADEWAIVWVETPMGQVSWHVPRDMAERLVRRNDRYEYDGHTREVKNDRMASWCDEGCWY